MTPRGVSAGPEPRIRSGSSPDVPWPPIAKPAIRMLPPVPTWARVEMFTSRPTSLVEVSDSVAALLVADPPELVATHV